MNFKVNSEGKSWRVELKILSFGGGVGLDFAATHSTSSYSILEDNYFVNELGVSAIGSGFSLLLVC